MTEDDDTDAGLADGTTNSNQSKIEDDSDDDDNKKPFKVERDVSEKIIIKLCIFLLESPCHLQCKIIRSISCGLHVLRHNEKQLLPVVAEVWKHIISQFQFLKHVDDKKHKMSDKELERFPVVRSA